MKISEKTINILKNFSNINKSIHIKPGSTINTVSPIKTVMAKASVSETFEKEFAIYELPQFLGVVSLFDDPELDFGDKQVKISSGKQTINYTYTDPSMVTAAPSNSIELPTVDAEFDVTTSEFTSLMRSLSVLGLDAVAITGEDGKIFMKAVSIKDTTKDNFSVEVGETNRTFKALLSHDNLKLTNNNYNVKLTSRGIAQFTSPDITYWVAFESGSKFED